MTQNTKYTIATVSGVKSEYTSKEIWESAIDRMIISRRERGIDTTRVINDTTAYFIAACVTDADTITFYDCNEYFLNERRQAS